MPDRSSFTFTTGAEDNGKRLDRVLADARDDLSRSRLKALIEQGHVTVSGDVITDANHRLKSPSDIVICVPPPVTDTPAPEHISLTVVYEDDDLIVVDKPAGLVVHPAAGNTSGTLVNALLAHCGASLSGIGGVKRPGIVHRLDKDTSGLIVAAKSDAAHAGLSQQFSQHTIQRSYQAVVWGVPKKMKDRISGAIGRSSRNRKKMTVVKQGGKTATTHYSVLKAFGSDASLVRCRLETGRTHQIRVHMAHIGHSLLGDPLYGAGIRRSAPEHIKALLKTFQRQALHAQELGFRHPTKNKELSFESALPSDMQDLIAGLEDSRP